MPFVVDPNGLFAAEIQADCTLGKKMGLIHISTIVVLGPKGWTEVADLSQLYGVVDQTVAKIPAASPPNGTAKAFGKADSAEEVISASTNPAVARKLSTRNPLPGSGPSHKRLHQYSKARPQPLDP